MDRDRYIELIANAMTITWDGVLNTGAQTVTATDGGNWWTGDTYTIPDYYFRTSDTADRTIEYSPPKRKAKKKEEELSAGDTQLLDEFLSGFTRNGA